MAQRERGSILDSKYEIAERLATGGMGEVYRARHVHLHEDRVIKILRGDKATDPQALQRFQQEARIATQIKHPNVATLYDFARLEDGSFYMVWEHIDGEDVGSFIKSKGHFPVPLAIEIAIQALRGLDAIHSAGVIHRDLSPDNLMLTRDRRGKVIVKIIDLGLAKNLQAAASSEITQAGVFMGKLMYCSPEQAGSIGTTPLDHRSDLYSLSAVIYEMVTGKPPFDSENPHGYVLKRLSEPPLPMVGRTPGIAVPPLLDEVVARGLAKDRERRWPDSIAFLRALVKVADELRRVSTQEIPAVQKGSASAPATPTISPRQGERGTARELSREERVDLLAQIDRAARRASETGLMQDEVQAAIESGDLEQAAAALSRLEAHSPHHAELPRLRASLVARRRGDPAPAPAGGTAAAPAPGAAVSVPAPPPAAPPPSAAEQERKARLAETEQLLERYIREHKQSLARFALESLLDLMPNHPRRSDYEAWVGLMGEEAEQLKSAGEVLDQGRDALMHGDLDAARRRLGELEDADPSHDLADRLRVELEEAEKSARSGAELDRRRDRLEQLIEERRLSDAARELERLSAAGLARVSVESYRLRMADIAALAERESNAQQFEKRYRERVQGHDWAAAREVALEFSRAAPDSPRPAQLFAEVSRLEEIHRKQQSIEQGIQQLEKFLADGKLSEAEMTLKIVVQMAPDHPQRTHLEQRVRALRERA